MTVFPLAVAAVFELTLRMAPNAPAAVVDSTAAVSAVTQAAGVVRYAFTNGSPVRAVVTCERMDADRFRRCRLDVETADGWHLEKTKYPFVRAPYPLAGDDTGDRSVIGATVGGVWYPHLQPIGQEIGYKEPGSLAAQFAAVYCPSRGVYLAAEDAEGHEKLLWIRREAEANVLYHERRGWETGVVTGAYDVVTKTLARGEADLSWEDFADLYRESWLSRRPFMKTPYLDRADVPAWMKTAPAMVRYSRQHLARPERLAASRAWWRDNFGSRDVIAAIWGWEKVGTWWGPDYFPAYPDDKTFAAITAGMRADGFHPFAWPSGYNWSECIGRRSDGSYRHDYRETFLKDAADLRCVTREGAYHRNPAPWMDNGANAQICGGHPKARAWFGNLVSEIAKRGCDMIQFDQSPGGCLNECWSDRHGHPSGPGKWNFAAFMDSYRAMRAALRGVFPSGCVCVEQPHEQLTGFSHLQDYRDLEYWGQEPAGVYAYLHHGYMPMFQSNPYRDSLYALAYMAVEGQIPFYVLADEDVDGKRPSLRNGGFEQRGDNARMAARGWEVQDGPLSRYVTPGEPVWDSDGAGNWSGRGEWNDRHSGAVAYRIGGAKPENCAQTVRELPEDDYVLSAWVKTVQKGTGDGSLRWGVSTGECGRVAFPAVGEWTKIETRFRFGGKLRVILHADKGVEALVDDVTLTKADGTPVCERGDSAYLRMMKNWVRLYQGEGRDFLAYGFREKPPKLTCATCTMGCRTVPAVVVAAYRAADGRRAIAVANTTDEPQSFSCTYCGRRVERTLQPLKIALIEGHLHDTRKNRATPVPCGNGEGDAGGMHVQKDLS